MKKTFMRNLVVVGAIHVVLLGVMFVFTGFRTPKYEPPPVNFIPVEIVADTRAYVVSIPDEPLPPEPEIEPEPEPEPEPEITVPKKKPAKKPPKKKPVKLRRRIKKTPRLTQKDVEDLLNPAVGRTGPSTPTTVNDATYRAIIRQTFYDAWNQPGYADVEDAVAVVTIRLRSGGAVASRSLSKPSGNRILDDSVTRSIQAVKRIPGLSSDFIARNATITVSFRVKDN